MKEHIEVRGRQIVPRKIEIELLSAMLGDKACLASAISAGLTREKLNYQDTGHVLGIIRDLFDARGAADLTSVMSEAFERSMAEACQPALTEIQQTRLDRYQFGDYLGRVLSSWDVRAFYDQLRTVESEVFAPGLSLLQREKQIAQSLGGLLAQLPDSEQQFFSSTDFAKHAAESFAMAKAGKRLQKVKTGIIGLDNTIGGLVPGRVSVFAARTSHGKTAFALYLCRQITRLWHRLSEEKQALYFSAEMSHDEMSHRALSSLSGVSATKIGQGTCTPLEEEKVKEAVQEMLDHVRIAVDCKPDPTTAYMMGRALAANAERKVGLIVFDYLEYTGEKAQSMDLKLDKALKGCHAIAKRIGCPVVVLSQISRELDRRGSGSRPRLSDLRYCGSIEQIASLVVMLYHPFTHEKQLGNDRGNVTAADYLTQDPNAYELLVEKNTHGPIGDIDMRFYPETGSFVDPMAESYIIK